MSLDDEHPTQYFGPDAVEFTGPHGKPVRVSRDHFIRLSEAGALTDEQMLHAKQDGLSLADILEQANRTYPVPVISVDKAHLVDPVYRIDKRHEPAGIPSTHVTGRMRRTRQEMNRLRLNLALALGVILIPAHIILIIIVRNA